MLACEWRTLTLVLLLCTGVRERAAENTIRATCQEVILTKLYPHSSVEITLQVETDDGSVRSHTPVQCTVLTLPVLISKECPLYYLFLVYSPLVCTSCLLFLFTLSSCYLVYGMPVAWRWWMRGWEWTGSSLGSRSGGITTVSCW